MNRTGKIKAIGEELTAFINDNTNLDPLIITAKVNTLAERYNVTPHTVIDSDGLHGLIKRQYALIGDLILMVVDYDTSDTEIKEHESDAKVSTRIYGIDNKQQFIESLDTDTKAGRVIYSMLTGKDIKETFN